MSKLLLTWTILLVSATSWAAASAKPDYTEIFQQASRQYDLPKYLLQAICIVETGLRPNLINVNDGGPGQHSFGICQVRYSTALELGFAPNPNCVTLSSTSCRLLQVGVNINLAAKYLDKQMRRYSGDLEKAISAYNAGSATNRNPRYVAKVLGIYWRLKTAGASLEELDIFNSGTRE